MSLFLLFGMTIFIQIPAVVAQTTLTVTNSLDNGTGSLRQAIIDANNTPGHDIIEFDIDGLGPHFIFVEDVLPFITEAVEIDGFTQQGAKPATKNSIATLKIVLNGGQVAEPSSRPFAGLNVSDNCIIRGIVFQEFEVGVNLAGNNNLVEGSFIGLNVAGTEARGNQNHGIIVTGNHNRIGGTNPASRNIISGNGTHGVAIFLTHRIMRCLATILERMQPVNLRLPISGRV